ncbi:MAG TPA: glycosyltransferase family 4 protein [Pirellulales bacterium]|nr:glycosyltransferase family 4 protein [Pirellulales bacterium]
MKLLAFTEGHDHVCYRYRLEAFRPALLERNWHLEAEPLARGLLRRVGQLRDAGGADVVVLQRKLLPLWQLRILRKHARRLVYDFDDALYCRDSYHPKGTENWRRMLGFWATIYAADAVTGGNHHLCAQAARWVPAERVRFVPTCVRPETYPAADHRRRGSGVKLVWIGQRSTLPSLHLAEPCLAAAAARLPGLQLRVVSDVFPSLRGIRVEPRAWSAATEAADVADADVGISWLPDDPWSLGKCGLKVLQYMAAGLPVVANKVGANNEMVVEGVTGFLVRTPAECADAIGRLAAEPELRIRLGRAGRELADREYSVRRWGGEWVKLCDELAGRTGERRAGPHRRAIADQARRRTFAETHS